MSSSQGERFTFNWIFYNCCSSLSFVAWAKREGKVAGDELSISDNMDGFIHGFAADWVFFYLIKQGKRLLGRDWCFANAERVLWQIASAENLLNLLIYFSQLFSKSIEICSFILSRNDQTKYKKWYEEFV